MFAKGWETIVAMDHVATTLAAGVLLVRIDFGFAVAVVVAAVCPRTAVGVSSVQSEPTFWSLLHQRIRIVFIDK